MKSIRCVVALFFVFAAVLAAAPFASAQNPFAGSWHIDKVQITGSMVLLIQNGTFDCKNVPLCNPEIQVKADGTDQPVSGHPAFDTISVSIMPDSFKMIMKKGGKIVRQDEDTLSEDGDAAVGKTIIYRSNNPAPASNEVTLKRLAPAPAGADKASGTWQMTVTQTGTDLIVFTMKSDGDGIDYSNPTGATWSAKFDGKDYPATGNASAVSLKRTGDRSFDETIKRGGGASAVEQFTLSDDGTNLTVVAKDPKLGSTTTYFAHK